MLNFGSLLSGSHQDTPVKTMTIAMMVVMKTVATLLLLLQVTDDCDDDVDGDNDNVVIYDKTRCTCITLGSHSGVSVRRASRQDSCSEEPGRLAVPQLRKWRSGSATQHYRRFVAGYSLREREFRYQIPRFNYNNVLSFTSWYIGNMPCASFYERKLLNFKNCADHRLGALSRVNIWAFLQTRRL